MKDKKAAKGTRTNAPAMDLLEDLGVPWMEIDADGIILWANRIARESQPEEQGDLSGQHIWDLMATEDQEISRMAILNAIKTGEDTLPVLRSLLTRDGSYRMEELHRTMRRNSKGHTIGFSILSFDVTEHVRIREEEHRARVWTEMLLESLPDAVLSVDALGIIHTANHAAEELTGWNDGSLIDQIVEKALCIQEYVSPDGKSLSHNIALAHPTKGFAIIKNLQQEGITVEIRTFPMCDKFTGAITGVTVILRTQIDLIS